MKDTYIRVKLEQLQVMQLISTLVVLLALTLGDVLQTAALQLGVLFLLLWTSFLFYKINKILKEIRDAEK